MRLRYSCHHVWICFYFVLKQFLLLAVCVPVRGAVNFSNQIAVQIAGGQGNARDLAARNGLHFVAPIGSLRDYYLLEHPRLERRSADHINNIHLNLRNDPEVLWVQRQRLLRRVKRDSVDELQTGGNGNKKRLAVPRPTVAASNSSFTDPLYPQQWYLHKGGRQSFDMNVEKAWARGLSGKGVAVTILDDGLQWQHPDLVQNYDQLSSLDINGRDFDPTPTDDGQNKHGTRCAGEVAAVAGNGICGVGIAFNASIGGVRMLDGDVHDSVEAAALSLNPQHVAIYSASWGPEDDGRTVDGPGLLAARAFTDGVTKGRSGLGSIYVWASGNGGKNDDSCSCDGYANSVYTISVSSAAQDGSKPWYLEECASTLTTTFSSGNSWHQAIVTTDLNTPGNRYEACTVQHTGTSASAPMAAAIFALALEANRNLTWRDMQHLVVRSSNPEPLLDDWTVNSLGRKVSNKFGYGLLDADRLVEQAHSWITVADQHVCSTEGITTARQAINDRIVVDLTTDACLSRSDQTVLTLEHVQAVVSVQSPRRGNLILTLISPQNTTSVLLPRRTLDDSRQGFRNWAFTSVHFWGENPTGRWRLVVEYNDPLRLSQTLHGPLLFPTVLKNFSLLLYGTPERGFTRPPVSFTGPASQVPILIVTPSDATSSGTMLHLPFSLFFSTVIANFCIFKFARF
ncbi:Furin-like protease 2 [Hypsibius exemplaris]|uniref:Furin-like protease 2 n=1 Tax=Hypsibius exemplaris TaxID=2072580 RepID=A0A1W0WZW9_HYPEX|nr:Furin-like protease 2 [Hypsibius exemplaris]